jgi:hypothetical protein
MPLLEQYVGHPVVVRVDQEALDPPDLTVEGMDGITAVHVCLTQRDNVRHPDGNRAKVTSRSTKALASRESITIWQDTP